MQRGEVERLARLLQRVRPLPLERGQPPRGRVVLGDLPAQLRGRTRGRRGLVLMYGRIVEICLHVMPRTKWRLAYEWVIGS